MRITVKHGSATVAVDLPDGQPHTVADLTAAVEAATGVFARHQKLVARGRVLAPPTAPLAAFGVGDGSSLMLLARGGAGPTVGGAAAAAHVAARRAADAAAGAAATAPTAPLAVRARGWAATGVVSLRGEPGLQGTLPPEALIAHATAVDVGGAGLASLPAALAAAMPRVTRLRADHNALTDVPALPPGLTALDLGYNPLQFVPAAVAACAALVTLDLSSCGLAALPPSIGDLTRLTALNVAGNQLSSLPAELFTGCTALASLDARRNAIASLPARLGAAGAAPSLSALNLDSNRLAALPPGMLAACTRLCDLSLESNPLTAQALAADPDYPAYDARRVAAANRRLGARVGAEGAWKGAADGEAWAKHAGGKK